MGMVARPLLPLAVCGIIWLGAPGAAEAGSFGIREQGARAQGMAFAGVAAGTGGLASIYFNPATLTAFDGNTVSLNASGIFPTSEVRVEAPTPTLPFGSAGDIAEWGVSPAGYAAHQIDDRLWIGAALSVPYAASSSAPKNWAGQVYSRDSEITGFALDAILGWKINDQWSVAIGPSFQYFDVDLERALSPLPGAPSARMTGDDTGVGLVAGVTWQPLTGTEIGVGYRSPVKFGLSGDLETPLARLPVRADMTMPETVSLGVSQAVTPDLTLAATVEWTNWSRLQDTPVLDPYGNPATSIELDYRDGWYYGLGASYRWNDALTLRAGIAYEQSPIDDGNRTTELPDGDRVHLAAGFGYAVNDHLTFDFAYAHIFIGDVDLKIDPGHPSYAGLPFYGEATTSVDTASAAIQYRF